MARYAIVIERGRKKVFCDRLLPSVKIVEAKNIREALAKAGLNSRDYVNAGHGWYVKKSKTKKGRKAKKRG